MSYAIRPLQCVDIYLRALSLAPSLSSTVRPALPARPLARLRHLPLTLSHSLLSTFLSFQKFKTVTKTNNTHVYTHTVRSVHYIYLFHTNGPHIKISKISMPSKVCHEREAPDFVSAHRLYQAHSTALGAARTVLRYTLLRFNAVKYRLGDTPHSSHIKGLWSTY